MSLAFDTFLLVLILIPGITFIRGFYTSPFSFRYADFNIQEQIIWTLFPAVAINVISIIIIHIMVLYKMDLKLLLNLFINNDLSNTVSSIDKIWHELLAYGVLTSLLGFFLGFWLKRIIYNNCFDIKHDIFRYQNSWFYYFTGDAMLEGVLNNPGFLINQKRRMGLFLKIPFTNKLATFNRKRFNEFQKMVEDNSPDLILIDALVTIGELNIIYSGMLNKFELAPKGCYDYIILEGARRRFLKNTETNMTHNDVTDNSWYNIPGQYIVLEYKSIINMNFRYIKIEEKIVNPD
jgi:hypothetical protein